MPYEIKGKCIYKKDGGAKVGCTKGDVHKYMAALHANVDETENKLVGGLADKLSISDIAKKHGVSIDLIKSQIIKGIKAEMEEHTNDKEKATEIAMDHLIENPRYYDFLAKMEKSASTDNNSITITESIKDLIKRLIRENLGKKDKFKQLALDNKYTIPKIPTEKIFAHKPVNINSIRQEADKLIDSNNFESLPIEIVEVKKIVPTQKFVTLDNLKSTQKTGPNTGAYLLCYKGLYYILDGHHRIGNNILDGNDKIKAYVYNKKTQ